MQSRSGVTTVDIPDDSLILTIHFAGTRPRQAAAGADAVARRTCMTRRRSADAVDRLVDSSGRRVEVRDPRDHLLNQKGICGNSTVCE